MAMVDWRGTVPRGGGHVLRRRRNGLTRQVWSSKRGVHPFLGSPREVRSRGLAGGLARRGHAGGLDVPQLVDELGDPRRYLRHGGARLGVKGLAIPNEILAVNGGRVRGVIPRTCLQTIAHEY